MKVKITKKALAEGHNWDKRDNAVCESVNAALMEFLGKTPLEFFSITHPTVLIYAIGEDDKDLICVGNKFLGGFILPPETQEWMRKFTNGATQDEIMQLPEIEFEIPDSAISR